jgi:hypothetical protein
MTRPVVAAGRKDTHPFPESAMDSAALVNATGTPYEATIWVYGGSEDSGGDVSDGFTEGATVPARIAPVGTSTMGGGNQVNEASTHVVTFGRSVSVKRTDQLEIDGTRYAITAQPSYGDEESGRRVEVREL